MHVQTLQRKPICAAHDTGAREHDAKTLNNTGALLYQPKPCSTLFSAEDCNTPCFKHTTTRRCERRCRSTLQPVGEQQHAICYMPSPSIQFHLGGTHLWALPKCCRQLCKLLTITILHECAHFAACENSALQRQNGGIGKCNQWQCAIAIGGKQEAVCNTLRRTMPTAQTGAQCLQTKCCNTRVVATKQTAQHGERIVHAKHALLHNAIPLPA
jgi:hypothetical protein